MKIIEQMNQLLQDTFNTKRFYIIFPFFVIALLFVAVYYLLSPFYMLFDLAVLEIKKELYDNEKICGGAQVVKFIFGYGIMFILNIYRIFLFGIFAIGYFIVSILFYLSSLGKAPVNCFAFHNA